MVEPEAGRNSPYRRVLVTAWGAAAVCLAVFLAMLVMALHAGGTRSLEQWISDRIPFRQAPKAVEFIERLAAIPGSRRGALLLVLVVFVWWWVRHRDLRPGVLLAAAFTGTTSTVAILKPLIVRASPLQGSGVGHAFPSLHTADAAAVLGTLAIVVALSHRRLLVRSMVISAALVTVVGLAVMAQGYHWFTDVVAGAAVAGVWVFGLTPAAYLMWTRPDLVHALHRDRLPEVAGSLGRLRLMGSQLRGGDSNSQPSD